jgi:hypothetical protein
MTVDELIEQLQKLKEEHGENAVGELKVFIRQTDICENGKVIEVVVDDGDDFAYEGLWIVCEDT